MVALYSHTTRSTGTTLTAAIYNADHQNHIDNGTPQQHDDYSANAAQMQSTTDPGESGSESLATSLAGEIERLRFSIKEIKDNLTGTTHAQWYTSPTTGAVWSTGDVKMTYKTTADSGWVMMDDGTIGNAASGATTRANADTESLFTLLWNNTADAQCAVSGGRGASAAADYAANKTIALPKALGRALAVAGAGSGLTSRVLALANGAETKTIATANLPASGLSIPALTVPFRNDGVGGTAAAALSGSTANSTLSTSTGTTGNMGSGTALDIMNPMQFLKVMIKL